MSDNLIIVPFSDTPPYFTEAAKESRRKHARFLRESRNLGKPRPKPLSKTAQRQLEDEIYCLKSDMQFINETLTAHMQSIRQSLPAPILEVLEQYQPK